MHMVWTKMVPHPNIEALYEISCYLEGCICVSFACTRESLGVVIK